VSFLGLASLILASSAFAQESEAPPVTVTSYFSPESAEMGQPLILELRCVHRSDLRLRIDELDLEGEEEWLLLEERRILTRPDSTSPGFSVTLASWGIAALEPGEHELQPAGGEFEWEGTRQHFEAPLAKVEVRGALAEGEDVPRPTIGFRDPPEERESPTALILAAFLVGIGVISWLGYRIFRRSRSVEPPAPPGPLERLTALNAADPAEHRELYFHLSRAVREAIDTRAGEDLSACTDEEWILRRSGEAAEEGPIERAAELLRGCEPIKYGAETPTRWAVEEALGEARSIVAACEGGES
jgi:hypothetical protein